MKIKELLSLNEAVHTVSGADAEKHVGFATKGKVTVHTSNVGRGSYTSKVQFHHHDDAMKHTSNLAKARGHSPEEYAKKIGHKDHHSWATAFTKK